MSSQVDDQPQSNKKFVFEFSTNNVLIGFIMGFVLYFIIRVPDGFLMTGVDEALAGLWQVVPIGAMFGAARGGMRKRRHTPLGEVLVAALKWGVLYAALGFILVVAFLLLHNALGIVAAAIVLGGLIGVFLGLEREVMREVGTSLYRFQQFKTVALNLDARIGNMMIRWAVIGGIAGAFAATWFEGYPLWAVALLLAFVVAVEVVITYRLNKSSSANNEHPDDASALSPQSPREDLIMALAVTLVSIASCVLAMRAGFAGQTGAFVMLVAAPPAMLSGAILEMMSGSNRLTVRQMVKSAAKGAIVSVIIAIIVAIVAAITWVIFWGLLTVVMRTASSLLVTLVTIVSVLTILRVRRITIIKLMPRIIKLAHVLAIGVRVEPPVVLAAVWIGWWVGFISGILLQVVDVLR